MNERASKLRAKEVLRFYTARVEEERLNKPTSYLLVHVLPVVPVPGRGSLLVTTGTSTVPGTDRQVLSCLRGFLLVL
jgi:hypothetical protein